MDYIVYDVAGATVGLGADGQFLLCRFDIVDPASKHRQPSGSFCTLTMSRADAERLVERLQSALNPP
jgi:hypothetical protein